MKSPDGYGAYVANVLRNAAEKAARNGGDGPERAEIEAEARERWDLEAALIVHRYGRMTVGEPIVLVVTASSHRQAAFESAEFLMDWLKTKAPFWKCEETVDGGEHWVDAREADDAAAARWG